MRIYESMIILRPDLTQEERESIFEKLKKKVKDLGGEVLEARVWREQEFVYPIRSRGAEKKKFNKGIYYLINFKLATTKLSDFKETIRLEERILRNLIIRRDG